MCPHCRAFITRSDRTCPYCNEPTGPPAASRGAPVAVLGGFIPHAQFVTAMILLLNGGLYAATALYSMRSGNQSGFMDLDVATLFQFGAKHRSAIWLGQWWRLITAGFLHGGLLHILMNSWALFDLGAQVEEIYGAYRLIVFYFAATVLGFLASAFWSPALSVGASAGVFGLIGCMIALGVGGRSGVGSAMRGLYVRWAVYGLLFGLLPGLHVDNAAHIGGLAGGFVMAYLAGTPKLTMTLGERFWQYAAYLSLLLTGFAFVQMFLWFTQTNR
jgi:rhomboid protease GluP